MKQRLPAFDELLASVTVDRRRFGHREHVHLTWLAVRLHGRDEAISLVSDGIRRTAGYEKAPQKYHATVSRAWVELVAHHQAADPDLSFDELVSQHPPLLDKRLLLRFYRSSTLATPQARTGWVAPDVKPFPTETPDQ